MRIALGGVLVAAAVGFFVAPTSAAHAGVTGTCNFVSDFVAMNDALGTAHAVSAGFKESLGQIRVDILKGPKDDPFTCENSEPWQSLTINMDAKDDAVRLAAKGLPGAYTAIPKSIPVYLNGGNGADTLVGHRGYDEVSGGGARDTIKTAETGDYIDPGDGGDRVVSGAGDDGIIAADGSGGDKIRCGRGFDQVDSDPGDKVNDDCELVV